MGGNDGWSFLNTVERWDPQFRSWNFVAPMNTPRSTHGVVAFNSKIFAVGGRDVSSCLRSVECFDPHFNRWTQMANLNKRRGMPGVAVFQDSIFAVGGHDTPGTVPIGSILREIDEKQKFRNYLKVLRSQRSLLRNIAWKQINGL